MSWIANFFPTQNINALFPSHHKRVTMLFLIPQTPRKLFPLPLSQTWRVVDIPRGQYHTAFIPRTLFFGLSPCDERRLQIPGKPTAVMRDVCKFQGSQRDGPVIRVKTKWSKHTFFGVVAGLAKVQGCYVLPPVLASFHREIRISHIFYLWIQINPLPNNFAPCKICGPKFLVPTPAK